MAHRSPAAKALPLVLVLTLVWGTNWALFPLAVREVSVWTFRAVSLTAAGVLLLAFARARGLSTAIPRAYWLPVTAAAVIYLVVWNLASTYAAILIPSGQAAILGFTMPMWTVLVVWALFGERPTPRMWLAVALAAAGVGLLLVPARAAYASAPAGFLLGLLAGFGWALGTVVLKRAAVPVPALVLTGWQLLIAALPLWVGSVWIGWGHWFVPSWQTVLVITYIAIVPMGIGNAAWFAIVGLLPASVAGLSSVMVPIVAMVTGAIVHSEPLGPYQLGAMACCGSALALALTRKAPQAAPQGTPRTVRSAD
ncbi:DMT family transporter [Ramlibacter alkalitolerans]|uniref:DMT family transporter n=1 Tax=Ramlibacter alkalitolerans TaxID=2039631 RepID=A0ABS1JWB3_9BURK|nr:DMT family transporter [Ramlibacter alkalitolerans]MBL0428146.1 DMT family transporter [Ramlibacter alkalitolerans]